MGGESAAEGILIPLGAAGGLGPVDSVEDFQKDLMLLAEVTERVASRDADMWARINKEERPDYFALVSNARRQLTNADAGFINAHDEHMPMGRSRRPRWLMQEFFMTSQEARAAMAASERIDGRIQGPELKPSRKYMPKVHELVNEGLLDAEGVRRIDKAIKDMPERVHDLLTERADEPIAKLAEQCGPEILNDLKELLWALLGEEEPEFEPKDHARKREVRISRPGHDGMSKLTGMLTPRCAAVFQRLLADYGGTGGLLEDGELEAQGLNEDPRTAGQRAHDCLESALFNSFSREDRRVLREELGQEFGQEPGRECGGNDALNDDTESSDAPDHEYVPDLRDNCLKPKRGSTSIVAVVTLKDLLTRSGFGMTDADVKMGVDDLIQGTLAQDFYLHVLDLNGRSLWLGRSQRLGSLDQYLALCGEEGGSTAPGSNSPPARCHIHHIDGWENGGGTDIENLTLTDPSMHARVDDSRSNPDCWWTVRDNPSRGHKAAWIPPQSTDPERKPQRNLNPQLFRNPGRTEQRKVQQGGGQGLSDHRGESCQQNRGRRKRGDSQEG